MKTIFSFFFICIFSVTVGFTQSNDLKKEVEAFVANYEKAYNAHDASAVAGMYTNDARMIRFDDMVISGEQNIKGYYAQFFGSMDANNKISIDDIVSLPGGNAYVTGHYEMDATIKASGNKMQMNGTYVALSQKTNGQWKIHRMMLMTPAPRQGG